MSNIVQLILSVIVVVLSFTWLITEDGFEPKVVFFTSIIFFTDLLFKYVNDRKIADKTEPTKRALLKSTTTPLEVSNFVKRFDKFHYRNKTIYSNVLIAILLAMLSYGIILKNVEIVSNFEKFLSGEKLENYSRDFLYKQDGELKTLDEFRIERNQVLAVFIIGVLIFLVMVVKPFLVNLVTKRLRKKLEFAYQLEDFEAFSKKTNEHLRNYQFYSDEVLFVVVNSFTRIKQECYMHNLMTKT